MPSTDFQILRCDLQRFLRVLRRAGLLKRQGFVPFVQISRAAGHLCLRSANFQVSVVLDLPGAGPDFVKTIDADALRVCAANDAELVDFNLGNPFEIVARWSDRGVPQQAPLVVRGAETILPSIPEPARWVSNEPGLIAALRDAAESTDPESRRFAIACVQLRSQGGRIAATDSRQLLVQKGYGFPWQGDRLIQASPVFGDRAFDGQAEAFIGESDGWVVVKCGDWTVGHLINVDGRFPDIDLVIPADSAWESGMRLDPQDAAFLSQRLGKLPCSDPINEPVTVDLNGSVAVRSRKDADATELVLSRSARVGAELRAQVNRRYLAQALKLGFREVRFSHMGGPCLARDDRRQFLWMSLDQEGVVERSAVTTRLESPVVSQPASRGRKTPVRSHAHTPVPAMAIPTGWQLPA